jgi:hypothetical protein
VGFNLKDVIDRWEGEYAFLDIVRKEENIKMTRISMPGKVMISWWCQAVQCHMCILSILAGFLVFL